MKLEEFVSETIQQIIKGVISAQVYATNVSASINPEGIHQNGTGTAYFNQKTGNWGQPIEFDISVTTKEEGEIKSGAGVFVSIFKVGVEGKDGQESSMSNRIKFTIPIFLPNQKQIK